MVAEKFQYLLKKLDSDTLNLHFKKILVYWVGGSKIFLDPTPYTLKKFSVGVGDLQK